MEASEARHRHLNELLLTDSLPVDPDIYVEQRKRDALALLGQSSRAKVKNEDAWFLKEIQGADVELANVIVSHDPWQLLKSGSYQRDLSVDSESIANVESTPKLIDNIALNLHPFETKAIPCASNCAIGSLNEAFLDEPILNVVLNEQIQLIRENSKELHLHAREQVEKTLTECDYGSTLDHNFLLSLTSSNSFTGSTCPVDVQAKLSIEEHNDSCQQLFSLFTLPDITPSFEKINLQSDMYSESAAPFVEFTEKATNSVSANIAEGPQPDDVQCRVLLEQASSGNTAKVIVDLSTMTDHTQCESTKLTVNPSEFEEHDLLKGCFASKDDSVDAQIKNQTSVEIVKSTPIFNDLYDDCDMDLKCNPESAIKHLSLQSAASIAMSSELPEAHGGVGKHLSNYLTDLPIATQNVVDIDDCPGLLPRNLTDICSIKGVTSQVDDAPHFTGDGFAEIVITSNSQDLCVRLPESNFKQSDQTESAEEVAIFQPLPVKESGEVATSNVDSGKEMTVPDHTSCATAAVLIKQEPLKQFINEGHPFSFYDSSSFSLLLSGGSPSSATKKRKLVDEFLAGDGGSEGPLAKVKRCGKEAKTDSEPLIIPSHLVENRSQIIPEEKLGIYVHESPPHQPSQHSLKIICSSGVTKNWDLVETLENRYKFVLIERNYGSIGGESGSKWTCQFADITVDERTAVVVCPLATLQRSETLQWVREQIVCLRLKFTTCWLLFFQKKDMCDMIIETSGISKHLAMLNTIAAHFLKNDAEYTVKTMLLSDENQLAESINQIADAALQNSQVWTPEQWFERDWITPEGSCHEQFLMKFPCINSFAAQLMLGTLTLMDLLTLPLVDILKMLPCIPKKVLQMFHRMVHQQSAMRRLSDHRERELEPTVSNRRLDGSNCQKESQCSTNNFLPRFESTVMRIKPTLVTRPFADDAPQLVASENCGSMTNPFSNPPLARENFHGTAYSGGDQHHESHSLLLSSETEQLLGPKQSSVVEDPKIPSRCEPLPLPRGLAEDRQRNQAAKEFSPEFVLQFLCSPSFLRNSSESYHPLFPPAKHLMPTSKNTTTADLLSPPTLMRRHARSEVDRDRLTGESALTCVGHQHDPHAFSTIPHPSDHYYGMRSMADVSSPRSTGHCSKSSGSNPFPISSAEVTWHDDPLCNLYHQPQMQRSVVPAHQIMAMNDWISSTAPVYAGSAVDVPWLTADEPWAEPQRLSFIEQSYRHAEQVPPNYAPCQKDILLSGNPLYDNQKLFQQPLDYCKYGNCQRWHSGNDIGESHPFNYSVNQPANRRMQPLQHEPKCNSSLTGQPLRPPNDDPSTMTTFKRGITKLVGHQSAHPEGSSATRFHYRCCPSDDSLWRSNYPSCEPERRDQLPNWNASPTCETTASYSYQPLKYPVTSASSGMNGAFFDVTRPAQITQPFARSDFHQESSTSGITSSQNGKPRLRFVKKPGGHGQTQLAFI